MAESGAESNNRPEEEQRPEAQSRIHNALRVEDRDWDTVSRRVATRLLAISGGVLALGAAGIAGMRRVYADKIFPKTIIGDVHVGGMTAEEAMSAVTARVQQLDAGTVNYSYESHIWKPTLTELGVQADIHGAVDAAMALGRDEKAADRLMYTSKLLESPRVVPLEFSINPNGLGKWFDEVDADLGDPAIDATFTIKDAKLVVTQDSTGTGADRIAVTNRIAESLSDMAPLNEKLPVTTWYPSITKADLEANADEVMAVLSAPVKVRFEDQRWEIQPEEVTPFMIFTSTVENGKPVTHVDFDRVPLANYLRDRFADSVNRKPINANVQFYQGQLTATSKSQNGVAMKSSQFADMVAASFVTTHEQIDIPYVDTPAKVREDNVASMGIKERLCRVDSNFQPDLGTDRAHNVEVGIRYINNTIVAPGDDFSFNHAVGAIDGNPEFVGGQGIVAGVIQDEFGGGICQVVTTAFRAAIFAGLPITEWYPHTYRLKGYERDGWPAGFDASILQPEGMPMEKWADLKFTNNTGNYILLSSWSDNGIHVIEIYGTDPGWDIQINNESQWEGQSAGSYDNYWNVDWNVGAGTNFPSAWPLDGSGATFTRTVYDADGKEMYVRDFTSNYSGRGWQCTCSADMEGIPCW